MAEETVDGLAAEVTMNDQPAVLAADQIDDITAPEATNGVAEGDGAELVPPPAAQPVDPVLAQIHMRIANAFRVFDIENDNTVDVRWVKGKGKIADNFRSAFATIEPCHFHLAYLYCIPSRPPYPGIFSLTPEFPTYTSPTACALRAKGCLSPCPGTVLSRWTGFRRGDAVALLSLSLTHTHLPHLAESWARSSARWEDAQQRPNYMRLFWRYVIDSLPLSEEAWVRETLKIREYESVGVSLQ